MLKFDPVRISQISASGQRVMNVACLIDKELLTQCYCELDPNKAVGIDKVTKAEYGMNLDANLEALVSRMKIGTYTPQPSKRVYIDKPGTNKKRPLGISCFEDKLVERAIAKILVAIYEPKFLDCSYGFRPRRNCHQAISKVLQTVHGCTSYVVEADIRSCFDTISHEHLLRFLEHDIADRKFIELINRGLKAGHMEDGIFHMHEAGTMQGSGYSPVLANVYLHYVLDTWFRWLKGSRAGNLRFRGNAELIRYADDFVCCFQYKSDAWTFYNRLKRRFTDYGFELAAEKTRVLAFGRFAEQNMLEDYKNGKTNRKKPETFCFLGFEFYCSKARNTGKFCCKVKSDAKRMRTKLQKLKEWVKRARGIKVEAVIGHFNSVLSGYFNYYGVTCNYRWIKAFRRECVNLIFKWMNRRSQRKSFTWSKFERLLLRHPIEKATIRVDIYHYRGKGCV